MNVHLPKVKVTGKVHILKDLDIPEEDNEGN